MEQNKAQDVQEAAKEIAQWAIDNRYPKSENDKTSDFEFYNKLKDAIISIVSISTSRQLPSVEECVEKAWEIESAESENDNSGKMILTENELIQLFHYSQGKTK